MIHSFLTAKWFWQLINCRKCTFSFPSTTWGFISEVWDRCQWAKDHLFILELGQSCSSNHPLKPQCLTMDPPKPQCLTMVMTIWEKALSLKFGKSMLEVMSAVHFRAFRSPLPLTKNRGCATHSKNRDWAICSRHGSEYEKLFERPCFEASTLSMPKTPMRYDTLDGSTTTARFVFVYVYHSSSLSLNQRFLHHAISLISLSVVNIFFERIILWNWIFNIKVIQRALSSLIWCF